MRNRWKRVQGRVTLVGGSVPVRSVFVRSDLRGVFGTPRPRVLGCRTGGALCPRLSPVLSTTTPDSASSTHEGPGLGWEPYHTPPTRAGSVFRLTTDLTPRCPILLRRCRCGPGSRFGRAKPVTCLTDTAGFKWTLLGLGVTLPLVCPRGLSRKPGLPPHEGYPTRSTFVVFRAQERETGHSCPRPVDVWSFSREESGP